MSVDFEHVALPEPFSEKGSRKIVLTKNSALCETRGVKNKRRGRPVKLTGRADAHLHLRLDGDVKVKYEQCAQSAGISLSAWVLANCNAALSSRVLHLTLYREFFERIAEGTKVEEYRLVSPYWKKMLDGKTYEYILFRNGYRRNVPSMLVECLGIGSGEWNGQPCYCIHLGKILWSWWPEKDNSKVDSDHCVADAATQSAVPQRE